MTQQTEREDSTERYMKTGFLARVAHDIRGPSGVALTAMDELETALGPEVARQHAALLAIMRRSTRRVLRISEKLARGAEAAAGVRYNIAPVALAPLVEKAAREAEGIEGRRNVTLVLFEGAASGIDRVEADGGWLEAVLVEIVSNAFKHARSKVSVTIEAGEREVAIVVTDDGRGPPPRIRRLFEPSPERSGLGISLSLAADFARAQDGRLEAVAAQGGGTTVRLWLRASAAATARDGSNGSHAGTTPGERPRVLVVDDDADTVELVSFALNRAGFETFTAGSVAEAKSVLAAKAPQALVTDLTLPDGSGTELGGAPGASRLRVRILVSGYGGEVVNRQPHAREFDQQLMKPIDLDQLVRLLTKSLA